MALVSLVGLEERDEADYEQEGRDKMRKALREAERQIRDAKRKEKELTDKIVAEAKNGADRVIMLQYAKRLVRQRNHARRCVKLEGTLQAIADQLKQMRGIASMASAMNSAMIAMDALVDIFNPAQIAASMRRFEKSSNAINSSVDRMDATLESIMKGEDDEKETEEVLGKVLDSILMSVQSQMKSVPSGGGAVLQGAARAVTRPPVPAGSAMQAPAAPTQEPEGGAPAAPTTTGLPTDAELESRFAALFKRGE